MPEVFEIVYAWWREDRTFAFVPIALVSSGISVVTASSPRKRRRVASAVIALFAPMCAPLFLSHSRPFATLDWVVVSATYILVAALLAWSRFRRVRSNVKQFFAQFNRDKLEVELKNDWLVAEGESSFKVLIYGIYGLAALVGSIICYLYIGVTRSPQGFIFQNNEGFIAALSLLIIVLAGAAVPIYSDLAKQVRTEIDLYEYQISSLQQVSTNAGHHADFLWNHFERVARWIIREWSSTINIQSVAQASHLMLYTPFLALPALRRTDRETSVPKFETVRDEVFKQHLSINEEYEQREYIDQGQTQVDFDAKMPGARAHYFTPVDIGASLTRVDLFLNRGTRGVPEAVLSVLDRRHRARRLRYLGWSLQGRLAIAQARLGDSRVLTRNHNLDHPGEEPVLVANLPIEMEPSWEFVNSSKYLVPATEDLFVAILLLSHQAEYDTENSAQTAPTLTHRAQLEFNRRARRHLHQWSALDDTGNSAKISQALATSGDCLDFDVSALSDDIALFNHLFIATKDGMNPGADARFLYYCFWPIALQNKQTRVSQVVGEGQYDGKVPKDLLQELFDDLKLRFTSEYLEGLRTAENGRPQKQEEFLLLSLADHKSALYNWLRAAKAVTTRKRLTHYESKLDVVEPETQFGIEVIPRREARLDHLRRYLDVTEAQKPLTVRSIFDLLPFESAHLRRQLRKQRIFLTSYHNGYRQVVDYLAFSTNFRESIGIDTTISRDITDIDSRHQWGQNRVILDERRLRFLRWIIGCFEHETLGPMLDQLDVQDGNYRLIIEALWCVSPAYQWEIAQHATPALQRTELTDEVREERMQAILASIRDYCIEEANAETMRNTFFNGSQERYNQWYRTFCDRTGHNNAG